MPGALTAGLMLEALTGLFPLYERTTDGAATYGALIALLLLLLTLFYLLGQITVIGALVNVELSREPAIASAAALGPTKGAAVVPAPARVKQQGA